MLGTSYFAIYDRAQVRAVTAETGVSFNTYPWEFLRPEVQRKLSALELRTHWYDTGKLMNILLADKGARLVFADLPALVHLGGISRHYRLRTPPTWWARLAKIRQRMANHGMINDLRRMVNARVMRRGEKPGLPVDRYFSTVLECLETGRPVPPIPVGWPAGVAGKVQLIVEQIIGLHALSEPKQGRE